MDHIYASILNTLDDVIIVPVNLKGVPYLKVFGKKPMIDLNPGEELTPGVPQIILRDTVLLDPKYYVLIPSSYHWRDDKARIEVTETFKMFAELLTADAKMTIRTVAAPLLGVNLFRGTHDDTLKGLGSLIELDLTGRIHLSLMNPYR